MSSHFEAPVKLKAGGAYIVTQRLLGSVTVQSYPIYI